jgi:uncharacterized protein YbjT (DUF2867 family)
MGRRDAEREEQTMRVFVAGATGAMGRQLVPQLVAAGHEVAGMTSKEANRGLVAELGATPVVADALDPDQVAEAVGRADPEVIVHQLTAIGAIDLRHMDRSFARTNRLRTEQDGARLEQLAVGEADRGPGGVVDRLRGHHVVPGAPPTDARPMRSVRWHRLPPRRPT